MLRVHLAGGLRLDGERGEIAPPRSRRARALLSYLAAHPGVHARSTLAARFWPDVLDDQARGNLRAALTELRAALRDEATALVATRGTVALDAWVDVRAFHELAAQGRLAEAAAVGEGELLPGMDEDWVLEARQTHAERRAGVLDALASAAEEAGDAAAAMRHARAALALDPLLDDARTRVARLTLARAARVPAPAALARAAGQPFVGRDGELAQLERSWGVVRAEQSRRLVLLAGEPGVGKTRLALRFAQSVAEAGAAVVLGRCSEEPLAPYEPFAEILRQVGLDAARALAGDAARELEPLAGAPRAAASAAPPADAAGARHRLFSAVDDALSALARSRPLLLMIEDVHWADRPTLLLLGFLLRSGRRAPVLAVATYRDTEVGRRTPLAAALADLRRDGGAQRIPVPRLDAAEVRRLAEHWLGAREGARVAPGVHGRTHGNAFFVEEVLRALSAGDPSLPESVRHSVGARLARLSPEADELAAIAATLGETVEPALLAALADRPSRDVERAAGELLDAHVLRLVNGSALEFPHALVREAVLADVNPLRRVHLHRRAAQALIAAGADAHLERIGHHLSAAGDGRAAEYLRRAGERAVGMLAYERGAELFAQAAEALPADAAGPVLVARGDALMRAGDPPTARSCFERAAALAREAGDAGLLARAALGYAGLGIAIIELDQRAIMLLEEALAAVGDAHPGLRSRLLSRLAIECYYAPPRDRSEALSAEAVTVARSASEARAVAEALNARHVALWRPDRLTERRAAAEELIAVAGAAGEAHLELQGRNWRVVDLFEALEIEEWRAEIRRHHALATRLRLPAFAWYTPLWRAVEAVHAGRFEEGARLRDQARREGRRAGDHNADLFAEMLNWSEAILRGDWTLTNHALMKEKIATSPAGMAWRSSYAWILADTGQTEAAREQLAIVAGDDFARLPFDVNWPSAMGECAEACALLGDQELAAAVYERLLPYADRALTSGRAVTTFGSTHRLLAGLAAVLGRADEAAWRHRRAIEINELAGYTAWARQGAVRLAAITRAS